MTVFYKMLILGILFLSSCADTERENPSGLIADWQQSSSSSSDSLTFTDSRDGTVYRIVKIDGVQWMAENLHYGTQVNGTNLLDNQSNDALVEKYCYKEDSTHCLSSGGLYQWAEAMGLPSLCNSTSCESSLSEGNHQGICPDGWHLPKPSDWDALVAAMGGNANAMGAQMKLNTVGAPWDSFAYNDGNSSGFGAFPAGRRSQNGGYNNRLVYAYFWTAFESDAFFAQRRHLYDESSSFYTGTYEKTNGLSVRCLRD